MTPTTLTGEFHMSEVRLVDRHPQDGHPMWEAIANDVAMGQWRSVIAYADKHAPTDR